MNTLPDIYRDYLECLNRQAWNELQFFVAEEVCYNDQEIGLTGYLSMLKQNYQDIPDLYFEAELVVSDSSYLACRLMFNCTPVGTFMGLPVNGRKIRFSENVFYEFRNHKISRVWSVIDKATIEQQLY
ncbi:ester cyclase [Mucilaginibacter sp. AK015]|uniref:ester cyclase n=1 Tax=Mucilaginibacter sp. AK015 TaxID=2723072 RepID=UPI0016130068|nr:ester cyclase [Mucilaginibacter sp. AK015]MBB5394804.1 putative ester cyclase [Mucilaginibacter sp. AK015]